MSLINIMAIQLAWLACIGLYCGSKYQLFLSTPLSKALSRCVFIISSLLSIILFIQIYHPLEAMVFWLIVIMLGWVAIVLAAPYCQKRHLLISAGSAFFLLTGLLS